jgi:hypothetical protein
LASTEENVKKWKAVISSSIELAVLSAMAVAAWFALVKGFNIAHAKIGFSKDFWDVITAVGTCAAAVVALWIGLRQSFQANRTEKSRAEVVAARIAPQLKVVIDEVRLLWMRLTNYDQNVLLGTGYTDLVKAHLSRTVWEISPETLASLAPISRHGAQQLARGLALVELVRSRFELRVSHNSNGAAQIPFSKQDALNWAAWVNEAQGLLSAVLADCEVASRLQW